MIKIVCIGDLYKNYNKGEEYLRNGLSIDYEYHIVIKELFPEIFKLKEVTDIINDFKNTSL